MSCFDVRSIHKANNPAYEHFIVGESIAILAVRIDNARICDVHDKVSYWEAKAGTAMKLPKI